MRLGLFKISGLQCPSGPAMPPARSLRPLGLNHAPTLCTIRARAVVGIDLGTSNSAVAVVFGGAPQVVRDQHGEASVPSVVAITQDDELLVGREAATGNAGPKDTFYSFKRLMGQKVADVADDAARLFYPVVEGDRGEALIYSSGVDDLLTPVELSGWLLRHLTQRAERHLRESVTGAVITVPAHFNDRQKDATLAAAAQAGLRQVHLLQEPVAAALAYGVGGSSDGETVLVFDVGGGTFDVSILQAFEGIMEVLGTAGDSHLGGDDFDAAVAEWILQQLGDVPVAPDASPNETSTSTPGGLPTLATSGSREDGASGDDSTATSRKWAFAAAQAAKVALSAAPEAVITAPDGRQLVLTQELFEQLSAGLFQRMAGPLAALGQRLFVQWAEPPEAAAPGSIQPSPESSPTPTTSSSNNARDKWAPPPRRITRVALVGQVTRLPSVRHFVRRLTGVDPCLSVDPGEAVALGAAIQAGVLLGSVDSVELMDGSFVGALHGRVTGFADWQP